MVCVFVAVLGCLVYELAALSPPFRASSQLVLEKKIRAGSFERIPRQYSQELERVIRSMIQVEQSKRPTVDEVIRVVAEREARVRMEQASAAAQVAAAAAHRRRNSLTSGLAGITVSSTGVVSSTGLVSGVGGVNLQLVQREAELVAQLAALQKREEEVARREAMVLARERRAQDREQQLDMREAMHNAAQKGLGTYRVPLSNLGNYIGQTR